MSASKSMVDHRIYTLPKGICENMFTSANTALFADEVSCVSFEMESFGTVCAKANEAEKPAKAKNTEIRILII
jgi:hypothetical protein